MMPGQPPKPRGRYNWQSGKVEPVDEDEGDELYHSHFGGGGSGVPGGGSGVPGPPTSPIGGGSFPPRRPGPQPNLGKPWQQGLRRGIGALTSAQMRQAAFRGPHGLIQGIRYAAGLPPIDRHVLGMYRAEALENLALNPRQFQSNEAEEAD